MPFNANSNISDYILLMNPMFESAADNEKKIQTDKAVKE